jgi:hypothetical protein
MEGQRRRALPREGLVDRLSSRLEQLEEPLVDGVDLSAEREELRVRGA